MDTTDTTQQPVAPRRRRARAAFGVLALAALAVAGAVAWELNTSTLQARWLAGKARALGYTVQPGASPSIRFPQGGPFDERLGYTRLAPTTTRLSERGYVVTAQARQSEPLADWIRRGYFAPYREKSQAGLTVLGCRGEPLYESRYPQRGYPSFDAVPRIVRETLAFIENRELLATDEPRDNPAVDPERLARAVADHVLKRVDQDHAAGGASTLATQIEKYRHSPDGRTGSAREKLRQMASASVRAYLDGEDTRPARKRILLDYVNTVPLGALRGWGEVHGIGDGLQAWYGADFDAATRLLRRSPVGGKDLARQALAYRQVLSLMIAQRRPAHYLFRGRAELAALTDSYLRLVEAAGIIGPELRDAALKTTLTLRDTYPATAAEDFSTRKAANFARTQLAALLDTPRLYDVDRLDLAVGTTIDGALQASVTEVLRKLRDPEAARAAGLMGDKLLERGSPALLNYSFTLFERGNGVNRVRVQTDNLDQPFDVNSGAKLELGSTAKLRTLVTYLELVAGLHEQLATLDPAALKATPVSPKDRLTRWAVDYLTTAKDRSLAAMLDAAMQRRYSASPGETFFTGGGAHHFDNYDKKDDGRNPTLGEALRDSINLSFIRLMREIVQHHMHRGPESPGLILEQPDHPQRAVLLARFADREGRQFTRDFYRRHAGKTVDQMLDTLTGAKPTPTRLAVIYRALRPEAGFDDFDRFIDQRMPALADPARHKLYDAHAPGRWSLADRAYLARVHPLELTVAAYLAAHPQATMTEVIEAGRDDRQQAYAWLLKSNKKGAQDIRIRTLLEVDAFAHVHRAWQRVGYPFDSLVPSYATAIGSSGDRPAALAELMGIIVNDGMRLPTVQLERLRFAAGTPYETALRKRAGAAERVFAPEIAATLKRALALVVDQGTARRLHGALLDDRGAPLAIGGKTGTGDNRQHSYGPHGALIGSRVLNRTATFVFYAGERHFGTLTAFVPGPEAEKYRFTSALPVQIMKAMAPLLGPAIAAPADKRCGSRANAELPLSATSAPAPSSS